MSRAMAFRTDTRLVAAMRRVFAMLAERLELQQPLSIWLAGGMAVHLYTGLRVTSDIDAEYGARILVPGDLIVETTLEDGRQQTVHLDTNYNATFALMHENYVEDALPVDLGVDMIRLHVLSPVDLAVSKIARFADNDREDIAALVRLKLTTADEIEQRANEAISGFVGGVNMLRFNIRDAVALARGEEGVLS